MRLFAALSFTLILSGCLTSPEQESFYKEVLMNGEVITSSYDANYGDEYTTVKYQGRLYQCVKNRGWTIQKCD